MARSKGTLGPIPSQGGMVADSRSDEETVKGYVRDDFLYRARASLSRATAASVDVSEAGKDLSRVRNAVARADDLDIAAQDANALISTRERERDHAERVAFSEGRDPVDATRDAQAALDAAVSAAATAERIADAGASEAARMAAQAERRAKSAAARAAPRVVREKLRELDAARVEARDAVEKAAKAMYRVSSLAHNVSVASHNLPDADPLHSLSRTTPFDPQIKPIGNSNRPSIETVIMEMRDVSNVRFSYGNGGVSGYQTLGVEIGKAVRLVREEDETSG